MPPDETSICRACGNPIEEHAARYRTPAGDTHAHCRREPRVLVIEGDSALRESIVGMVKRIGYLADDAANGEEAIERLPRYLYDVILCALRMPAMDGPAFYREVRSRYPGAGVRIIFMTAHAELQEYAPFLTDVGAPVLRKPFSIEELRLAIASPAPTS
jgi:two-component system response regulator ResD